MRELTTEGESMRRYMEEEKAEILKEVESLRNVSLGCQETWHAGNHNSKLDKEGP